MVPPGDSSYQYNFVLEGFEKEDMWRMHWHFGLGVMSQEGWLSAQTIQHLAYP